MRYGSGPILFFMLTLMLCLLPGHATADPGQSSPAPAINPLESRHILLLNSYHQRMTWVKDIVRGVEDVLRPDENNLSLHVENMDSKKHHSAEYYDIFYNYLKTKYKNTKFSLILSSDNNSYNFLRKHRDVLFPGVPVSFCGVNGFNYEQIADIENFTGVAEIVSARETAEMALRLHPNVSRIFVINDYLVTGRAWAHDISRQLRHISPDITIKYADNLPIGSLMKTIAGLEKDTLILLGSYFSDRDGNYFTYERVGEMLSKASRVPIYCLLRFNIGKGVIGGKVISGYYQGRAMAVISRKILSGTPAQSIPVIEQGSNKTIFNYNQLKRFNLKESRLPPQAIIINKPHSFYDEYKAQIQVVTVSIAILLLTILTLVFNIRKRIAAEEALRTSEERFRQLANAGWEAISIHEDGHLLQANKVFFDLFGYSREELIGKRIMELIFSEECLEIVKEKVKNKDLGPYEVTGKHKNGSLFPMEIRVREMKHEGKNIRMAAMRDLTERKAMEEKLSQSMKLEAIGTLAGGIAHDFNNILSAILGYSELTLLHLPENSQAENHLKKVLDAGNRARSLVQQILTFARESKEELQPVQVSLVVNEALKLLRASLPTSIEIKKQIISDSLILGDPTQIHQIVMNLCTNAGKAMADGGVLSITLTETTVNDPHLLAGHPEMENKRYLQLIVKDTGSGIAPEIKNRIFDPFFTTRSKESGTGLGLSVVHGIVKNCKGIITVTSEIRCGSTFTVFLPVIDREIQPVSSVSSPPRGGTGHIMFIDDESSLVEIAESFLKRLGYRVSGFTSSMAAIEQFRTSPEDFDLVITDMTMPRMTGDNLSRKILAVREDIPIILCTGFNEQISEKKAREIGIKAFLMKPVDQETLAGTIENILAAG
ncbi:hybrid sensor histidine kinase/response regulator [Desulfomarina sp.]